MIFVPNIDVLESSVTSTRAYQSWHSPRLLRNRKLFLLDSLAIYFCYSSVQEDILRSLNMSKDNLFCALHPFNRENLYYQVIGRQNVATNRLTTFEQIKYLSAPDDRSKMADVFNYITTLYRRRGRPSSGIIYCRKRVTCNELSGYLSGKGLNARPYHRGIGSVLK